MKYLKLTAVAGVVSLALVGCGGDSSSPATTPVTFSVSDAPIDDVESVVITVGKVALRPKSGTPFVLDIYKTDENGNPIDENGQPIEDGEPTVPLEIDLLKYQGSDSLEIITNEIVPVDEYTMCMFVNDGDNLDYPSYVIEVEGQQRELTVENNGTCPGVDRNEIGDNVGILFLNKSFNINTQSNNLVIDFDLRRGLKKKPSEVDYSIQRTSVSIINTAVTGNIEGTVSTATFNACNNPADANVVQAVYLYESGTTQENMAPIGGTDTVKPLTSASVSYNETQQVYEFSFGFLDPGSYNLGYTCTAQHDDGEEGEAGSDPVGAGFTIYEVKNDVTVTGNQDTIVAFGG